MCRYNLAVPMRPRSIRLRDGDPIVVYCVDNIYSSGTNGLRAILADISTRLDKRQLGRTVARRVMLRGHCVPDLLFRGYLGKFRCEMRKFYAHGKRTIPQSLDLRCGSEFSGGC